MCAYRRISADGSPIVRDADGTQINHSGVLFGQAFLVFTFSDGKVVRWRDYRTRAAAVPAAGASVPDWMAGARYEIIGSGKKRRYGNAATAATCIPGPVLR
jgi:hypothetical protein